MPWLLQWQRTACNSVPYLPNAAIFSPAVTGGLTQAGDRGAGEKDPDHLLGHAQDQHAVPSVERRGGAEFSGLGMTTTDP